MSTIRWSTPARFVVNDIEYKLALLNDPEVSTDPTLLLFREDEEEAIATIHLDPSASCNYFLHRADRHDGHIIARPEEED